MKFFVAVAEELHFTRASVRVRIAQPHLSQEIRRLEREIGVELFTRTKRSVALTPAGRAFLERVRVVLDNTADAVHAAQRANRGEIGRIRLGFTRVAAVDVIPDATARFRSAFPDVEVLLKDVTSDAGIEALRNGQLDLCLLHPPRIVDPALASRLYDEVIAACAAAGFAPRIVQWTERMTTKISMVASGIGVTLMPITQARMVFGGAVYRQLRPPARSIPVAFAWRRDQTAHVLARFMAVVRQSESQRKVGS